MKTFTVSTRYYNERGDLALQDIIIIKSLTREYAMESSVRLANAMQRKSHAWYTVELFESVKVREMNTYPRIVE